MMPSDEMDKLTRRALKAEAFQHGRSGTQSEDEHLEWMTDKWATQHGVKISAAYYDGAHCTQCLNSYAKACLRLKNRNLIVFVKQTSGIDGECWNKLNKAVLAVGVPLPGTLKMDFDPTTLLPIVPSKSNISGLGNDKKLAKSRRKASYDLLEACTGLINLVMDWVDVAIGQLTNNTKARTMEISVVRALVGIDFFQTLDGYLHGHCHLAIFESLSKKMLQLPHD
jgi:hypothetical protein